MRMSTDDHAAAEDAARRLRGESCANCGHYSTLTGCWSAQAAAEKTGEPFHGAEFKPPDCWCAEWHLAPRGLHASTGKELDSLAISIGVARKEGEPDSDLRQRVNDAYLDEVQAQVGSYAGTVGKDNQ